MRHRTWLLLACVTTSALAARRSRSPDKPPPPAAQPPQTPPPPVAITAPHPIALSALPQGISHASAQTCAACHPQAFDSWRASAHAGPPSDMMRDAARRAATPACLSCHLPLTAQYPTQWAHAPTALPVPTTQANADWAPTLTTEGVTCLACHLSEGTLLTTSSPPPTAPHSLHTQPALDDAATCASCHQLSWPGASQPLYDTWGEYSRSDWAKRGVSCVDCHTGKDHSLQAELRHGMSVLFDLSAAQLVRGAEPIAATINLVNTGAGHSIPTGSPFVGLEYQLILVPPDDSDMPATQLATAQLGVVLAPKAPWDIVRDTRIISGQTHTITAKIALPTSAEAGRYKLRVQLRAARQQEAFGPILLSREVDLMVR